MTKKLYRDDVLNALKDLSNKSAWMLTDEEAPIHEHRDKDCEELLDLCLTVFRAYCSGTKYFLNKELVLSELENVLDRKACERSLKI
jgi:hypothetical protein